MWLRLASFLIRSILLATRLGLSCSTLIDGFDGLSGTIGAIFVKELRDDGDRLVELPRLCRTFIMHGSLAFIASDNLRLAQ